MGSFFKQVYEKKLLKDAPAFYDWLFDDTRFTGAPWDAEGKGKFTKKLKHLGGFGNRTFKRKTKADSYPVIRTKRNRKRKPFALFSCDGSEGQAFVRHVRNAIAHGQAEIYTVDEIDYAELRDFGKYGQTSYIAMPVSYLDSIYLIYREVEVGKSSDRKGRHQ